MLRRGLCPFQQEVGQGLQPDQPAGELLPLHFHRQRLSPCGELPSLDYSATKLCSGGRSMYARGAFVTEPNLVLSLIPPSFSLLEWR